jgi:D-sedoheptulose 7-phosphate isomerase
MCELKLSTIDIVDDLIKRKSELDIVCSEQIYQTIESLVDCFNNGNKLLVCGNGGSAADAQHIVGELMKPFKLKRDLRYSLNNWYLDKNIKGSLPVISLISENPLITAIANDMDKNLIFAQQVFGLGKENDCLLAISTSGNSKNIICACQIAKALGMKVIGLTGRIGEELKQYCDICICASADETYLIQELHLPIYHTICLAIENEIFGE